MFDTEDLATHTDWQKGHDRCGREQPREALVLGSKYFKTKIKTEVSSLWKLRDKSSLSLGILIVWFQPEFQGMYIPNM